MPDLLEAENYYHIYNRGINKENLFVEDVNYGYFLEKYKAYCFPVLDTYAFCLLKNHFHLFVRVRSSKEFKMLLQTNALSKRTRDRLIKKEWSPTLVSQQLGHLFNGYTQAFNKRYNRTGSLFQRPFKRKRINENSYFRRLICYIHKNPQLHGFVDDYREYPYSSYRIYFSDKNTKLNVKETVEQFGGMENFLLAHETELKQTENFVIEERG